LPINSPPEVLGLNANAEIDSFTSQAHKLWNHLLILRRDSESDGLGANSAASDMSLASEVTERILQSLPSPFDREALRESLRSKMTPTTVVLLQELSHFNRLVNQMQTSLGELKRSLSGEVALSSDLEQMAISLCNGQLPSNWRNLAPETRKSLPNCPQVACVRV
uniref:Dynein_C domain-containing protein n=1 Tax=Rodentolepis nana TaxID=102285 RepID=A0A0R3TG17_RODNA